MKIRIRCPLAYFNQYQEHTDVNPNFVGIDIIAELYTHVGHTPEDLLTASRSLGEKTFDPDSVRDLLEAKIVSALRSYAATKTLTELHENRDLFALDIKTQVLESFGTNGLVLQEVTIVSLEQTAKEYFKSDNIFDAEGLKIITAITSEAKRKVHDTEKRTSIAIRQKELDTQLELLEIERQEAFAKAGQDKDVSNEQALQVGAKQRYVLDQKLAVEQKEIENEQLLEQRRTERDISVIEESRKRELSEIEKTRIIEEPKTRPRNRVDCESEGRGACKHSEKTGAGKSRKRSQYRSFGKIKPARTCTNQARSFSRRSEKKQRS